MLHLNGSSILETNLADLLRNPSDKTRAKSNGGHFNTGAFRQQLKWKSVTGAHVRHHVGTSVFLQCMHTVEHQLRVVFEASGDQLSICPRVDAAQREVGNCAQDISCWWCRNTMPTRVGALHQQSQWRRGDSLWLNRALGRKFASS